MSDMDDFLPICVPENAAEIRAMYKKQRARVQELDGENQALEAERDYWRTTANALIGIKSKVQKLEGFIKEIRDELLYPLSFNSTHLGQVAEGFGSCIPKLLEENDDHL
jgi:hypothetical protein